jgi:hypothetical protein
MFHATTKAVAVFPNPYSDYLRIRCNEEIMSQASIIIQDILGKMVIINELNDPFNERLYNGNLTEGVYLIKILIENTLCS